MYWMFPLPWTCFLLHSVECQLRCHLHRYVFLPTPSPITTLHCSAVSPAFTKPAGITQSVYSILCLQHETICPMKAGLCLSWSLGYPQCLNKWLAKNRRLINISGMKHWINEFYPMLLGGPRVMDGLWLNLREEMPHPISSPLSHRASWLIHGHLCGKAQDLISQLELTPGPPAKHGRGSWVRTLKGQEKMGIPVRAVSGKTVQFPCFSPLVKSTVILL